MDAAKDTAENLKERAVETAAKAEEKLTVLWHEIAEWQQDNQYIHSGYRPASNSYKKSIHSLSYIHNETVNIYTHLLGAIFAIFGSITIYIVAKPRYEMATPEDMLVFSCFFLGAVACLGMSATFHTISNHSPNVASFGNQLDYLGILCLIWGSFIPALYYAFQRDEGLLKAYIALITTNCLGTAILCITPRFRTSEWRPIRAGMFVLTGLSGVVPVGHGAWRYGISTLEQQMGLSRIVIEAALYISGAAIYAARVPERLSPGKFDIWGSSHQIFHCFVLAAAIIHFSGIVKAFDYWHSLRPDSMHLEIFKHFW